MCETGIRKCAADGIDVDQLHYLNWMPFLGF